MKLKTTIILLVVAVIGISYVLLYEKKQMPQEEWERLQKKVIPDFKSSMIKKIELNNESGKIVLEKKENDFWYITEPQKLRADNSEINSILSEFEFMSKVGSFKKDGDKPYDLKDYGLDIPVTTITMYTGITVQPDKIRVTGPKDKYTVFVGQKLAAGNNVYIKLDNSEEVVVVPGTLSDKVCKNVLDLRSKWVFTFDKEAVDTLQIKSQDYNIVCKRDGRLWRIAEPVNDIADLEKIRDILGKFKNLQVAREDFLAEDPANLSKYGLDNPGYTINIIEKGVTQSVLFGHSLDNKVYAKRTDESTVFLLKDTILIDLNKKPNDFRDRKVVRFESYGAYGINKLEIKTPSELMTIEKSLDLDWKITSPVSILADQDTVRNFIEKIKTLDIEDFVSDKPDDLAAYGLKDPVFEIAVTKEEDKELARFYVGNKLPEGDKCYVKRVGEEPVYTVPAVEFYDKIENALLSFRDRLVCDFNRDLAKKVVIEKSDRTYVCEVSNKKGGQGQIQWELSMPVQVVADVDAINQIIWDMSFLKVENFVLKGPKDLKPFGLENPLNKVSVTYEKVTEQSSGELGKKKEEKPDGAVKPKAMPEKTVETRTLLIGKKVAEEDNAGSYGMFSDSDLVFILSWPKVRNFNAELVPTKVFDFDRTNIMKLTLSYPEGAIQMEKINNVWKFKDNAQKIIQGREIDYFVQNLSELKASYVEQFKATNLTQFSLDTPPLAITIGLESGDAVLYIGKKKDEEGYYVKNRDSDYIYVVDKKTIVKLMKREDDFTKVSIEATIEGVIDEAASMTGKTPLGSGPHGSPSGGSPHGGTHGGFH